MREGKVFVAESPKVFGMLKGMLVPKFFSVTHHIDDSEILQSDLGIWMKEMEFCYAIIHANKPEDREPVLSVYNAQLPLIVIQRTDAATSELTRMYEEFENYKIPLVPKDGFMASAIFTLLKDKLG